jgi:glycerol-3-phosphate acyltransferase PlsY
MMSLYLVISIIIGYLLGAISPAWILGKVLRGIDIRKHGTLNAGTTNVYHILGLWPAAVTAIYDFSKGLLAIWIAWRLGVGDPYYLLPGIAAFLGHIYPFYLHFRGGQGSATILAIFFFLAVKVFLVVSLPWHQLLALAVIAIVVLYVSRIASVLGIVILPLVWVVMISLSFIHPEVRFEILLIILILVYLWYRALTETIRRKMVQISDHTRKQLTNWRTFARPLAIFIPIIYLLTTKETVLWVVGLVGAVFILIDLSRLVSKGFNLFLFKNVVGLFKEKDRFRFSSMTFFMLAAFLSILLFDKDFAVMALSFIIFGDLTTKFFGGQYSRIMLFRDRSLEGLLTYFAFSLFFGIFFADQLGISIIYPLIGAATAATTDLFSIFGIDDNFTVALISGSVMQAVRFFV